MNLVSPLVFVNEMHERQVLRLVDFADRERVAAVAVSVARARRVVLEEVEASEGRA